jgi:hypothetical protein
LATLGTSLPPVKGDALPVDAIWGDQWDPIDWIESGRHSFLTSNPLHFDQQAAWHPKAPLIRLNIC